MEEWRRPVHGKPQFEAQPNRERKSNLEAKWDRAPIVWAVDAFPEDPENQDRTVLAIRAAYPDTPIHPVYVLNEELFTTTSTSNFLKPALKPMALRGLHDVISRIELEGLHKPRVLIERSGSKSACAKRLVRYAQKIGAQTIALGTHARQGLAHFFIGSFSEAIASSNPIPVVVTGPEAKIATAHPGVIVCPTDFSPASRLGFVEIVETAKSLGADICLFHKTIQAYDPIIQSGVHMLGGGWVSVEAYMRHPPDTHDNEAQTWLAFAETQGVVAHFNSESQTEPTPEAIVNFAMSLDRRSPWIAMVSHARPVSNLLFGSVTRDVLRTSPYPVYLPSRT